MNNYDYLVDNENSSELVREEDTNESNMMCSSWQDDLEDMCFYQGDGTCGDRCLDVKDSEIEE